MPASPKPFRPQYHAKRAQHHLWQDGIFEILIGIGAMLYALLLHIFSTSSPQETVQNESLQTITSVLLFTGLTFCGVLVFRVISNRLKENIVYPRTGFVKPRLPKRDITPRKVALAIPLSLFAGAIGLVGSLGILYLFARFHINISLVLLSTMLAFPVAMMAWRTRLPRLYAVAVGILLISIILTMSDTFGSLGMILLYGSTGVLLSLSGGLGLWAYLRQNHMTTLGDAADGDF